MTDKLDYVHELGNGWGRYENMVLTEMKRLADNDERTTDIFMGLQQTLAVMVSRFDERIAATDQLAKDFEQRMRAQEEFQIGTVVVSKDRKNSAEMKMAILAIVAATGTMIANIALVWPH